MMKLNHIFQLFESEQLTMFHINHSHDYYFMLYTRDLHKRFWCKGLPLK